MIRIPVLCALGQAAGAVTQHAIRYIMNVQKVAPNAALTANGAVGQFAEPVQLNAAVAPVTKPKIAIIRRRPAAATNAKKLTGPMV